ncbi:2Fe-2S iron-sulfur cluster-binding protein [Streptomyces sp. NRRL F-5135]|uniref:2Fe-2S iron-sulfur cluster-binding protein n=1 Tax=Streptomyces sp. NRRL F-5135 TaxID=1463858 RepID=UPI00099BDCD4
MTTNENSGSGPGQGPGPHGEPGTPGTPGISEGHGGWQPIPHGGEYDAEATAFVQLPPEDTYDAPLAAPGHGYVPPHITTPTVDPSAVDPSAGAGPSYGGGWVEQPPAAGEGGAQWPDPQAMGGYGPQGTQGTGQWNVAADEPGPVGDPGLAGDPGTDGGGRPAAGGTEGGSDLTGRWTIPVAQGDLPDESGEFSTSVLAAQWGGGPAATLPGGTAEPWSDPYGTGADQQPYVPGAGADGGPGPETGSVPLPGLVPDQEYGHGPGPAPVPGQEFAYGPGAPAEAEPAHGPQEDAPREAVTHEAVPHEAGPHEAVTGTAPEVAASETAGADVPAPPAPGQDPAAPGAAVPEEPAPGGAAVEAPAPDASAPDTSVPDTAGPAAAAGFDPAPLTTSGDSVEHPSGSYVLRVNGTDRPVTDAWIGESLLYVLRERLGLAGAKDGCSQGECGACNVQVDGRLVASCLVPAATAAGSEVRTVEGLAVDGEPSDVQRALAKCGAVQCGFCIPGMAMTVHDLLEGNHAPSELETRQALCGNLCRCSGYRGVLDAVSEVVAERTASAEAAAAAPEEARIPHQAPPGAGSVQPPHSPDGGMA